MQMALPMAVSFSALSQWLQQLNVSGVDDLFYA